MEILTNEKIFYCQKIHAEVNILGPHYKGQYLSNNDIYNVFVDKKNSS